MWVVQRKAPTLQPCVLGRHEMGRKRSYILPAELCSSSSSDDEDYQPSGSASRRQTKLPSPERTQLSADRRGTRASTAQGGQATPPLASEKAPAQPLGPPAPHLPEAVLHLIMYFATEAGGAIPLAPVASCVSRSWRQAVRTFPDLWQQVDLSSPKCQPTDAVLVAHGIPRWGQLQELRLASCHDIGAASLAALAHECKLLEHLELTACGNLAASALSEALEVMVTRTKGPGSAPLTVLKLTRTEFSSFSGLGDVVRSVLYSQAANPAGPVLQSLTVTDSPGLSHQGLRAVCTAGCEAKTPMLRALRVLNLSHSASLHGCFFVDIERLQYNAPNIEELDLDALGGAFGWFASNTPSPLPDGAVASFPRLRICRLGMAVAHPSVHSIKAYATDHCAHVRRLLMGCSGLQELDLSGREHLLPSVVVHGMIAEWPLTKLVLQRCGAATNDTLMQLARLHRRAIAQDASMHSPGEEPENREVGIGPLGKLQHLAVSNNLGITDEGLCHLHCFQALRHVDLSGTRITTGGVEKLKEWDEGRPLGTPPLVLLLDRCRGVDRRVRQAAAAAHDAGE